jgi:hypothetical protein
MYDGVTRLTVPNPKLGSDNNINDGWPVLSGSPMLPCPKSQWAEEPGYLCWAASSHADFKVGLTSQVMSALGQKQTNRPRPKSDFVRYCPIAAIHANHPSRFAPTREGCFSCDSSTLLPVPQPTDFFEKRREKGRRPENLQGLEFRGYPPPHPGLFRAWRRMMTADLTDATLTRQAAKSSNRLRSSVFCRRRARI